MIGVSRLVSTGEGIAQMPKYIVRWTELNHFESAVEAKDEAEAFELATANLGEYQDHEWGGIEEDSIEFEVI